MDDRQNFVNTAISYLGVVEGSEKHKYIIDTYNKISPLPQGYKVKYTDSWCATFVSAIAKLCGLLNIIPAECSCPRQIALWQKLGKWQEDDSYTPMMGDIIYYDFDDNGVGDNKGISDHVGIVVSVLGNNIKVIEGNKNDSVSYRTIAVNAKYIRGFGCPSFASKTTEENVQLKESVCSVELKILKQGSKGNSVKALQILLKGYGYGLGSYGVDGDFGQATLSAVKKFQSNKKISSDGIVGLITWKNLLGVV